MMHSNLPYMKLKITIKSHIILKITANHNHISPRMAFTCHNITRVKNKGREKMRCTNGTTYPK